MDENEWLADRFEEQRAHLRAVAYRMLGSFTEADDAVQDTRLQRALWRSDTWGGPDLGLKAPRAGYEPARGVSRPEAAQRTGWK